MGEEEPLESEHSLRASVADHESSGFLRDSGARRVCAHSRDRPMSPHHLLRKRIWRPGRRPERVSS